MDAMHTRHAFWTTPPVSMRPSPVWQSQRNRFGTAMTTTFVPVAVVRVDNKNRSAPLPPAFRIVGWFVPVAEVVRYQLCRGFVDSALSTELRYSITLLVAFGSHNPCDLCGCTSTGKPLTVVPGYVVY